MALSSGRRDGLSDPEFSACVSAVLHSARLVGGCSRCTRLEVKRLIRRDVDDDAEALREHHGQEGTVEAVFKIRGWRPTAPIDQNRHHDAATGLQFDA